MPACALPVFMLLFITAAPAHAGRDTMSVAFCCTSGLQQLDKGKFDEALYYFSRAFSAGMSKDSLCFFCAEVYFVKGALDTALGFNFGIKASRNRRLAVQQLKQRVRIYSALGWKKDADAVADSLLYFRPYGPHLVVPDVNASAGLDYTNRREKRQPSFPYQGPLADTGYKGPGYSCGLRLGWAVPAGRSFLVKAGVSGEETSKYYRSSNSADSVNVSMGLFAGLEHIPSGLALDYGITRVVDYLGEYFTQNSIGLSLSKIGKEWLAYFSGGYERELEAGEAVHSQTCWLLGYFDQSAVSGRGFSVFVRGSGYFAGPLVSTETFKVMYVADVTQHPVQHYYVNTQTQTPTSDTIGIGPVPYLLPAIYENNTVRRSASALFSIPENSMFTQNQLSIAPLVMYKQPIPFGMSASIGAGVTADYYPDPYRWASFNIKGSERDTSPISDTANYLAYNAADGKYYWVKDLANISGNEQYDGPVAASQHEKRRVDVEVSLFVSLTRPAGELGTFTLRADIAKNYSTLRSEKFLFWQVSNIDAPFSIPNWSCGASLTWSLAWHRQE